MTPPVDRLLAAERRRVRPAPYVHRRAPTVLQRFRAGGQGLSFSGMIAREEG